jgi:hypothetical protein
VGRNCFDISEFDFNREFLKAIRWVGVALSLTMLKSASI